MKINQLPFRIGLLIVLIIGLTILATRLHADSTGTCSGQMITIPFDDVSPANIFFCSIASAFFSGLTNGTSATTYSPSDPVPREQMAAFITRTLDQSLRRGSRRAALGQFWTISGRAGQTVGYTAPMNLIKSDGTSVYIAHGGGNRVIQKLAGDPQGVGTETFYNGIDKAYGIVVLPNYVFVTSRDNPGKLFRFLPGIPATTIAVASNLGAGPTGIAYDGERIWTANADSSTVSICGVEGGCTNVPGFSNPFGIIYDGANIWVTNYGAGGSGNTLVKLNQNGAIIQTVTVGQGPAFPMYDGTNIWVPNYNASTISVVRAATGQVLATLTGNGLNLPNEIAFDGQRVIVTNNGGESLSLWKAADLMPLGSVSTPTELPVGVCSDGQNFWITALDSVSGFGSYLKF
jgi:hypothetical protein